MTLLSLQLSDEGNKLHPKMTLSTEMAAHKQTAARIKW
jgi:hypothetical protein